MEALLQAAIAKLEEYGVTLTVVSPKRARRTTARAEDDYVVSLSTEHDQQEFAAVLKSSVTMAEVFARRSDADVPLLFVLEHLSPRMATAMRDANVQFIDVNGNANIRFANVVLDVRGRRPPSDKVARDQPSRTSARNLFSPRRSQVIMALLAWPELSQYPIREVAEAAGVSTGQAHDTLTLLEEAGYPAPLDGKRRHELLDLWAPTYVTALGASLMLAVYVGDPASDIARVHPNQAIFLSGESAHGVAVKSPLTKVIYVDEFDPKLAVVNRWRKTPDMYPNVFVRRKFWASPRAHDEIPLAKGQNAPWPLVYADLLALHDPRADELARDWKQQHV